ncbi:MAG: hypothetical protein HY319_19865 [Armatimonadetes bacterium]|nr:hypothetical protein [Armatimonadota bacterium]
MQAIDFKFRDGRVSRPRIAGSWEADTNKRAQELIDSAASDCKALFQVDNLLIDLAPEKGKVSVGVDDQSRVSLTRAPKRYAKSLLPQVESYLKFNRYGTLEFSRSPDTSKEYLMDLDSLGTFRARLTHDRQKGTLTMEYRD